MVLWNLNKRLRYVLDEHDEPLVRDPGLVDLYVGFTAQAAAHAFSQAVPSAGAPVAVDGRPTTTDTVRWEVSVRSTTLPLSAEFDLERTRLLALAATR